MVWDFTCPDTLAASYVYHCNAMAEAAADAAEELKIKKYALFTPHYDVVPVAVETMRVWEWGSGGHRQDYSWMTSAEGSP